MSRRNASFAVLVAMLFIAQNALPLIANARQKSAAYKKSAECWVLRDETQHSAPGTQHRAPGGSR
ncbi:MAG: hypothetical protein DMF56_09945 [Acidobacteria bacterium]|nr:MAG: hypothetical protein DMF56_09945 [Acidobacteriota bacterium]